MSVGIESALQAIIRRTPARHVVSPDRGARFLQFCGVGAAGMVIDLAITFALLAEINYLAANAAGFVAAVSFNFAGNWLWTYNRPEGSLRWQYTSYVVLHGASFAVRALSIAVMVEVGGIPATVATLIGVGIAAMTNFAGSEGIFGGDSTAWFDVVEAGNHLAHVVYNSRIRGLLVAAGVYQRVFDVYAGILRFAYRAPEREISVGDASASVKTELPTETVSVLHTLEKERDVLDRFVDDVESDDTILDVGANVGVWSSLGGDIASQVVAVEPHRPTAERCGENLKANEINGSTLPIALGSGRNTVSLAVTNDAVGTQRPEVDASGTYEVQQWPGDDVEGIDDPDIVKIDVEGAESAVLDGLSRTLTDGSARVIYLEAHSQTDADALVRQLREYGYNVETVVENEQVYLRGER